jgi:hypothetical protein
MKKKTGFLHKHLIAGVVLLVLLVPSACRSEQPATPPTLAATVPQVMATPTPMPSKTLAPSQAPTDAPTITRTLEPSPTATIIPSPTISLTPLATLAPTQAYNRLVGLIFDNGGCKLPCWWGITPGKSSWGEAYNYLHTFAISIDVRKPVQSSATRLLHTGLEATIYYHLPGVPEPSYFEVWTASGIVDTVSVYEASTVRYQLAQLLTNYGKPAEVYINTFPSSSTNTVPMLLILHYPEQGILAFYNTDARIVNGTVTVCQLENNPMLRLWAPAGEEKDRLEKQDLFALVGNWKSSKPLLPLNEASSLSIDDFYKLFKSPGNGCIKSPAELWK